MSVRIPYYEIAKDAIAGMTKVEAYTRRGTLGHSLLELVKMRASQINGCGYCLDMHSKDARVAGETEQRLYVLSAWREAPFYTERERAALEWTEAVTLVSNGVHDDVFERVRKQFTDEEMVELTVAIVSINSWNRLAIGLGADIGSYKPGQHS